MLSQESLQERIMLHDAAQRLGLKIRQKNSESETWSRPDAEHPEILINRQHGFWRMVNGQGGGNVLDLAMWAADCDYPAANKLLHDLFHIHYLPVNNTEDENEDDQQLLNYIAQQNTEYAEKCRVYLKNDRGIPDHIITAGIKNGTLGWTDYTNPKLKPNEPHYGGEAVSFLTYLPGTRSLAGVDYRYYNPDLNGGMKTKSLGKKNSVYWTLDPRAVRNAHTVYVVEGPLDALSIEAAFSNNPGVCAIALRGTQVTINWKPFQGKRVISCYDKDAPKPDKRNPNGLYRCYSAEAEWRIHEACLAAGVACFFVDRMDWDVGQDANDVWKATKNRHHFEKLEPWLIPGLSGKSKDDEQGYKQRIFLPHHDYQQYWRFRVKPDFTSMIKISKGDDGETQETYEDVAGFRVAGLSRVKIASATAIMSGEEDSAPRINFVAIYQSPRGEYELQRRVMEDEQLHNLDQWRKAGPIFRPAQFARMLSIFERTIGIGSIHAANFVGLCYLNGKVRVNEGKDCFFTDPKQQCPYNDFSFHRGMRGHVYDIMTAYQDTFKNNAAALALTWVVGAQLKLFLGFWPHMIMQADKGRGKSTLIKRLERTTGMKMFSGQSMGTEYRLLTSVSGTSHPIGWEEISARKTEIIQRAVSLLQECYQYTETTRGSAQTHFLVSAPVLLAGEDVPVESITGKTVRTNLNHGKGALLDENLPKFPMYEWCQWLAELPKSTVLDCYKNALGKCQLYSRARADDSGAQRMVTNYAALMTAWRLIRTFGGWEDFLEEFERDLIAEMNAHIADTNNDREPWIWIVEIIADEISADRYPFPYKFEKEKDSDTTPSFLLLRTTHMMSHLSTSMALKEKYNNLPVKTGRGLKRQIDQAGVIAEDDSSRSINGKRVGHMQKLDLRKLEEYGVSISVPEKMKGYYEDQHASQLL